MHDTYCNNQDTSGVHVPISRIVDLIWKQLLSFPLKSLLAIQILPNPIEMSQLLENLPVDDDDDDDGQEGSYPSRYKGGGGKQSNLVD